MDTKRQDEIAEQPDEQRREFLEKAAKVGVAAPAAVLLLSAANPQAALGYGGGGGRGGRGGGGGKP